MAEPRVNKKRTPKTPNDEPERAAGARATRDPEETPDPYGRAALFPDLFRRALAMGLSGLFTTEEAVRRAFGETVPQDWVDFATDQSERTRSEFVNRLAGEMARVLEGLDLEAILQRVIENHTFEINAQIRIVPTQDKSATRGRGRPHGDPGKGE